MNKTNNTIMVHGMESASHCQRCRIALHICFENPPTLQNLLLKIYCRMVWAKQFLPVKHLTARHSICETEHTNAERFSSINKMKRIAKFFDFRLNVTHTYYVHSVLTFCFVSDLELARLAVTAAVAVAVAACVVRSTLSLSSCRIYQKAKNNFCSVSLFSAVFSVNCNRADES